MSCGCTKKKLFLANDPKFFLYLLDGKLLKINLATLEKITFTLAIQERQAPITLR